MPKKEAKKWPKFRPRASWLKFHRRQVQPPGTMKIENLTKKSGSLTWSDAPEVDKFENFRGVENDPLLDETLYSV